jgi:hypothetical protein
MEGDTHAILEQYPEQDYPALVALVVSIYSCLNPFRPEIFVGAYVLQCYVVQIVMFSGFTAS